MVYCHSPLGFEGYLVSVEVDLRRGIPITEIVGLPAGEVKESRERVRSALRQSGFQVPQQRVLINLAPAAIRKRGAAFDLALAVALLQRSQQLSASLPEELLVMGELRLDGSVLPVTGVLAALLTARKQGVRHVVLPRGNLREAAFFTELTVYPLGTLAEILHLVPTSTAGAPGSRKSVPVFRLNAGNLDFADVRGQRRAKRAILLAAAGGHHCLLLGPPGTGKSMIAHRFSTIAAPLSRQMSLEATTIHSISGKVTDPVHWPPVRSPHHSASLEGIIGGGAGGMPGEVSLAHGGLLLLDEALEFGASVLQGLREPLETRIVRLARADYQIWYPAGFTLLLTSNLCPCGGLGKAGRTCSCTGSEISRYWRRLGGALLDRIAVRAYMGPGIARRERREPPDFDPSRWESSEMADRVRLAREIQRRRYRDYSFETNSQVPPSLLKQFATLHPASETWLRQRAREAEVTVRGEHAAIRVARTLADLAGRPRIIRRDLEEAVELRQQGRLGKILSLG